MFTAQQIEARALLKCCPDVFTTKSERTILIIILHCLEASVVLPKEVLQNARAITGNHKKGRIDCIRDGSD